MRANQRRTSSEGEATERLPTIRPGIALLFRLMPAALGMLVTALLLAACSQPQPQGFELEAPDETIQVVRGDQADVLAQLSRDEGFAEPVELTATSLPSGLVASTTNVASGDALAQFTLSAATEANLGLAQIEITAAAPAKAVSEPAQLRHARHRLRRP